MIFSVTLSSDVLVFVVLCGAVAVWMWSLYSHPT